MPVSEWNEKLYLTLNYEHIKLKPFVIRYPVYALVTNSGCMKMFSDLFKTTVGRFFHSFSIINYSSVFSIFTYANQKVMSTVGKYFVLPILLGTHTSKSKTFKMIEMLPTVSLQWWN